MSSAPRATPGLRSFSRILRTPARFGADIVAFFVLAALAVAILHGARDMAQPLSRLEIDPITLDPHNLPIYGLLTTIRMFVALAASLIFTLIVGTLAARSRRAEQIIIPALDILQSVPSLGFLTVPVTFFMGLFPGHQFGVELAAIFAIFTSQAWNITFSYYQSLRSIPADLDEVSRSFSLSSVQRFARLDLPFATPALVWTAMMSMSGGWFFIVASEAITVGNTSVALPGIGSWLALAIEQQDMTAIGWAVAAMVIIILFYDQFFFRPVVAWADRFRFEQTAGTARPRSWVFSLIRRTHLLPLLLKPFAMLAQRCMRLGHRTSEYASRLSPTGSAGDQVWRIALMVLVVAAVWVVVSFLGATLTWSDAAQAIGLACLTLLRVLLLIALASLIWVPIGVWIGLRPVWAQRLQAVAQVLAAFPANVLFPIVVLVIVRWQLNPEVWLSPLMILGTQWYILFNVIAGASAIPNDLREAASMLNVRGWQWWRQVALPGIFPFYVTGALTASGGSWNASIVAEVVSWGDKHLRATGLGAYIADATTNGDHARVALGIAVMSAFVIGFNRLVWRPMYVFAERRLRLG
jgi:NitT/TauT family transport system permease protein